MSSGGGGGGGGGGGRGGGGGGGGAGGEGAAPVEAVAAPAGPQQMINLKAWQGEVVTVPLKVARLSTLVASLTQDLPEDATAAEELHMETVKIAVLRKVCEFLAHLSADAKPLEIQKPLKSANLAEMTPPLDPWYIAFVACDLEMLYELILAANFMDIKPLLELCCARLAAMMLGKSHVELREMLGIVNDFTPEEEAQVLEENKWAEEPAQ